MEIDKTIQARTQAILEHKAPVGESFKVQHSKLLALAILVAFVNLSLFYLVTGLSVYFFLDLCLWGIFYWYSRKVVVGETFEFVRTTFIFFLVLLSSVALFGISAPRTFSTVKGSLSIYQNQTLNIVSTDQKARGTIGLRVRLDEATRSEYLQAYYNILITDEFRPNGLCGPESALFGCDKNITYEYAGDLVAVNEGSGIAEGGLVPVFCNKESLPVDPFGEIPREHSIQNCNVVGLNEETDTFLLQFIKKYTSISELLQSNQLHVYDGSYFWEKATVPGSVDLIMNLDKAVSAGWKTASYELIVEN